MPVGAREPARPGGGAVALVLHAHLPYVEGFGTWPFGEEWLFEALATVYLPLLDVVRGARMTIGLSPVLCDQLETLEGATGERFLRYLDHAEARHAIDARAFEEAGEPALAREVGRAAADYGRAHEAFEATGRSPLTAWRDAARHGAPALMTSAATHPVLPLIATDRIRRLQVATGIRAHRRRFGDWAGAFWLPECAYAPELEEVLDAEGVRGIVVDQTRRWGAGSPNHLEPIETVGGRIAIPLDWDTVALVWDESTGYPTAPGYRDHHHRRTLQGLKPWSYDGEPYDHDAALDMARRDAHHFVDRLIRRLADYRIARGRPGLLCCAFDAELFGHWWYEGTEWLREVIAEATRRGVELVTVPDAIESFGGTPGRVDRSTWAVSKDFSTWAAAPVAGLRRQAETAEIALLAAIHPGTGDDRLLRAARELLALQASDWAFLATRGTAGDYPRERAASHAEGVERALAPTSRPSPHLRNLAPDLTARDVRDSVVRIAA
jgi:1,4-alpha-glucan branching enzyme